METIRDFNSIVHSQPFTFLVGRNHTQLTIQSALVRHVSKPLDHLMNNGETRESKVRIAVLEDEEVEVFVAFCEYAYTNDYTVPPGPQEETPQTSDPWTNVRRPSSRASFIVPPPVPSPPLQPRDGAGNDESRIEGAEEPVDAPQEQIDDDGATPQEKEGFTLGTPPDKKGKKKGKKDKKKKGDELFDSAAHLTPPSTPPLESKEEIIAQEDIAVETPKETAAAAAAADPDVAVETDHEEADWWEQPTTAAKEKEVPIIDTSFAPRPVSPRRGKSADPWEEFAGLEYVHELPTQRDPTIKRAPPNPRVPYLTFHAKVYVFATRYLIPGLAQLCLKKLHQDLLGLTLTPVSFEEEEEEEARNFEARAKMVLDLLYYTYTKTTRFEPVCQTSATLLRKSELRKLVIQYAACKMKELAAYTPGSIPVPVSLSHGPGSGVNAVAAPGAGLRELLDTTTELASDLVYRIMYTHM
ncbi:hypothetical protein VTN77DRAFT_7771 [Rasamsonia byssochlamydoides]|uniref:uncharacterized protein n=1 Tax=Rasamsonia byssochlamydoides TaxID=89139 RepID=UPI003742F34F